MTATLPVMDNSFVIRPNYNKIHEETHSDSPFGDQTLANAINDLNATQPY